MTATATTTTTTTTTTNAIGHARPPVRPLEVPLGAACSRRGGPGEWAHNIVSHLQPGLGQLPVRDEV